VVDWNNNDRFFRPGQRSHWWQCSPPLENRSRKASRLATTVAAFGPNTKAIPAATLAAENRDPKMIWYAPEKKWIVALYLDRSDYACSPHRISSSGKN